MRTVQRHGEDIRALESGAAHIRTRVDELRKEQQELRTQLRRDFDRIDDKLDQVLRQR